MAMNDKMSQAVFEGKQYQWLIKIFIVVRVTLLTALFTNMRTLKFKSLSQLRFSLPSIIITNPETQKHKTDRNPPITDHKPWPFKPVKVKFCFLRGPLRWSTAAKNTIVSWVSNFRIRMFVKSAVTREIGSTILHTINFIVFFCSLVPIFY